MSLSCAQRRCHRQARCFYRRQHASNDTHGECPSDTEPRNRSRDRKLKAEAKRAGGESVEEKPGEPHPDEGPGQCQESGFGQDGCDEWPRCETQGTQGGQLAAATIDDCV